MNGRSRWARAYGASPWHLLALALCFLVAGYAATRVVEAGIWLGFLGWFFGAVIIHDLVLFPLYSAADFAAGSVTAHARRRSRRPARYRRRSAPINYLRVPAVFSGLLLLVWFPLILRRAEPNYRAAVGLSTLPYLTRWILITLVLFAASALLYVLRRLAAGRIGR
ncbi:hypothetical protein ITP53_01095 [Nonomuraea sp. K274]|uniref:Uncharacterized protein n=1 Tax=Nonomuraea cypriaca TaxID=1187855 RepID=A0A931A3L0_9ACTN|nr:hypothetical protein [Nonomuraea cypriaca]MBF8184365.1 hypothetical protein [Nonomuraea cypriaca]